MAPDDFASDVEDQSNQSYQEPAFEAFMCPLTRQVMHDPVTIETGQTFERGGILKWFRECRDSGRKPTCPLTQRELGSTEISPSIALRNVIDEWRTRNEEKELEKACDSLKQQQQPEDDDTTLRALAFISHMCQRSAAKKNLVRKQGIIPAIADMLKGSGRRVRLKSLEALRVLVDDNDDNREELGKGDTIRTIIKFLSNEHFQERELAVSLLYELSKCEPICERIGAVYGAILLLVGMGSSKAENNAAVEKAENTLKNLERCETNVKQMAENGRLQPLLTKLIQGTPQVQLAMAEYLGELALANDVKVVVAEQVGALLVSIMKTGSLPAREATLKALREISSNDSSANILLDAGILPPLVKDLFSVGAGHLPMRLKEASAAILANLVASGVDFRSIPLDDQTTLLSEDVVHSLLHLISNTGPAIECSLLNVLVGLTGSPETVADVVSAILSSGASISLIQFVEAAHREIRLESLKLLRNVSPYMGAELADALGGSPGHLGSLLRVVTDGGVTEEQAAALGLLGDLPERDLNLTRQLLDLGAFRALASKLAELRRGAIRGNRHVAPFTEGAVKVLHRVTCALQQQEEEDEYVEFAREAGLAPLFVELLLQQMMPIALDAVQLYSAMALENLSLQSRRLTAVPEDVPAPPTSLMCACFPAAPKPKKKKKKPPAGTCRVHGGFCSLRHSFCLAQPGCKAVERLVACLEHADPRVVEAALAALSTLVGDAVENATEGVLLLGEADGLRPIVEVLVANRTEALQRRAVWAVERILRVQDIALDVAADQSVASALVEAYRNSDDTRTRQTAERALRHLDRIPNFSTAFHSTTEKGRA
jgi:DNA-binding transcriptional ArsR family regulator